MLQAMQQHSKRRLRILQYLAAQACSQTALHQHIGGSIRNLRNDLRLLQKSFPHQLHSSHRGRECLYYWQGPLPHPLGDGLSLLGHDQLIALVTARGLFRSPQDSGFQGPLDSALDRLLRQLGVSEIAQDLHPQSIEVDRFAACPENPEDLMTSLDAVIRGQALRGCYRNREGRERHLHILPLRLLLIEGEFHLLAWESRQRPLSDLRLSRFSSLCSDPRLPPAAPARDDPGLLLKIQRHREASFRTHGNYQLKERQRLQLAIGPRVIPHLRNRNWGLEQQWDHEPPDLARGWSRLSFITAGTPAALHWILSLGDQVIVESPESLRQSIAQHAKILLNHHSPTPPKNVTQ